MHVGSLAAVGCLSAVTVVGATDWSTLHPQLCRHVVRVMTLGPDEDTPGTCSGIVLGAKRVLTAGHCVTEKASYTVHERHATVVAMNRILDLAVLQVDKLPDGREAVVFAPDAPLPGTAVLIVGYAFGMEGLSIQDGIVSQTFDAGHKRLVINADVAFGQSGGPVFNKTGQVVGLVVSILSRGPAHLGLAVPSDDIVAFVSPFLSETK